MSEDKKYSCHKISGGKVRGEVMASADDICFYLVDPKTGIIIEDGHEAQGRSTAGRILVFPSGKGSSVVQTDGLYQLMQNGMEPRGMVIKRADTVLTATAIILETPLVDRVDEAFFQEVETGDIVEIDADQGVLTLIRKAS